MQTMLLLYIPTNNGKTCLVQSGWVIDNSIYHSVYIQKYYGQSLMSKAANHKNWRFVAKAFIHVWL